MCITARWRKVWSGKRQLYLPTSFVWKPVQTRTFFDVRLFTITYLTPSVVTIIMLEAFY